MSAQYFHELLKLAADNEPNAESVLFFQRLLEKTELQSNCSLKDLQCNRTTELQEQDDPEVVNLILKAIYNKDHLSLNKLGVCDYIPLEHRIQTQFNLNFSQAEIHHISDEHQVSLRFVASDIIQNKEAITGYDLIDTIENILDRVATSEDDKKLGDMHLRIDSVDVTYDKVDDCYDIILTGFKHAIEAVLEKAQRDGELELDNNWRRYL
jgi:hypothetical protein